MIKTRTLGYWDMFWIWVSCSAVLYAVLQLLVSAITYQIFDSNYSWIKELGESALFGLFLGGIIAFLRRQSAVSINFDGSPEVFQRVAMNALSELGYQVVSQGNSLIAHRPSKRKTLLISEVHLQVAKGQALLDAPWIDLRRLKSTIETTASVVNRLES